jgi:hypothetical protein
MLTNVTRDAEVLPEFVAGAHAALLDRVSQRLLAGWPADQDHGLVAARDRVNECVIRDSRASLARRISSGREQVTGCGGSQREPGERR